MDKTKNIYQQVIEFIDNNKIVNQVIKLIVMCVMMFYNLLTLIYIYKVIVFRNITFSSISLMIYLLLLAALSIFIMWKKWDYKYICVYLLLISLFF